MKRHIVRIILGLAAFWATNLCYGQDNQLPIANGFMNEIKTFLTEEGFTPKIEDGYINFKKEGLGFHIQITGTGPYIYQFYVDAVQMPENMDLNRLLIDINNASSTGALIHSVYQEENSPMNVLIRIAGATRSAEDFKYVFYTYLAGLQYGYNQALSYAQDPGKNYPNPEVVYSRSDDLKIKNVHIRTDMTIIDFEYTNTKYINNGYAWYNIDANSFLDLGGTHLSLLNAEGIEISPKKTYFPRGERKALFRLYFQPLPKGITRFDFIENKNSSWYIMGVQLKDK